MAGVNELKNISINLNINKKEPQFCIVTPSDKCLTGPFQPAIIEIPVCFIS